MMRERLGGKACPAARAAGWLSLPAALLLAWCAACPAAEELVEIPGVMDDPPAAAAPKADGKDRGGKPRMEPVPDRDREDKDREPAAAPGAAGPQVRPAEVQEIIPMPVATRLRRGEQPEVDLPASASPAPAARPAAAPLPPLPPSPRPAPTARAGNGGVKTKVAPRLDDVIAELDGERITRLELYDAMVDNYGAETLARILNRRLLKEELRRGGIAIGREELASAFAAHMQRLTAGTKGKVDVRLLLRRRFGLTPQEYQARIVWVELALRRLVRKRLHITDGDVFNYYYAHRKHYTRPEEVRASHILISPAAYATRTPEGVRAVGAAAWNRAYREALRVQVKLREGADFAYLARKYSHDKSTAARGGDIGYFPRGRMLKPFEDAAFALKKGETSDLVKTSAGYHLILVTDRVPGKLLPFSEVKTRARKDYENYLVTAQSADMLERIKRTAMEQGRLKILDPDLRRWP